jgi:predicted GNAT family acetyltransferase
MTDSPAEPSAEPLAEAVTSVVDAPERSRYEATLAGAAAPDGAVAGFVVYRLRGQRLVLVHTEVDPAFEGKGVGSALAKAALEDIRRRGLVAVVQCPFITTYLRRHPEYADLTD